MKGCQMLGLAEARHTSSNGADEFVLVVSILLTRLADLVHKLQLGGILSQCQLSTSDPTWIALGSNPRSYVLSNLKGMWHRTFHDLYLSKLVYGMSLFPTFARILIIFSEVFLFVFFGLRRKIVIALRMKPRLLPSTSVPIHYSVTTVSLDAVYRSSAFNFASQQRCFSLRLINFMSNFIWWTFSILELSLCLAGSCRDLPRPHSYILVYIL